MSRRHRTVAVVALLTAAVTVPAAGPAGADPPAPAGAYDVAAAVDADPAPDVFETTLVTQTAVRDVGGGVTADVWTFNGTVPGPEIRVRVGDTVVVHYRNELPLPSAIHWHGIELNNASDGSDLTQNAVAPGGSFLYRFVVPRPGIFWYHPHHHPTNQVFRGLYGSLIVTDAADDTLVAEGVLPPREHTRTLVLSDTTVCKAPGQNDTDTYDDSLPWAGGGPLPEQPGPFPSDLCDRPMDDHGQPIRDESGQAIPMQAGEIPNIQRPVPDHGVTSRTNEGQTVLANGRNRGGRAGSPETPGALAAGASVLVLPAGQGLRLQAVNAATVRYFRLLLTDRAGRQIPLVRVGGEGGLLDSARVEGNPTEGTAGVTFFDTQYRRGEIVLGPSDRADLVVAVPPDAPLGTATLWTLDYRRTGTDGWARIPTVPVMHLDLTEPVDGRYTIAEGAALRTHPAVADPVERLGSPRSPLPDLSGAISPLLDPATFSPPKEGSASEDIQLTTSGNQTSIDNVVGTHDPSLDYTAMPHARSSRYARIGDLLELTVTNPTSARHTFHLHGFSFQPLAFEHRTSLPYAPDYVFDYGEFVDTVDVPPQYTLRFRVRLDDRPQMDGVTPGGGLGRWVFHCHIFFHATLGMHAELVVLAPDGNERPYVNADETSARVGSGGRPSMTGNYVDPDGDPVLLRASTGTVIDVGGGRWLWTRGPGGSAGDRTIYVTAVDTRGLANQTAFDLRIDRGPQVSLLTATATPMGGPLTSRWGWCRFDDGGWRSRFDQVEVSAVAPSD